MDGTAAARAAERRAAARAHASPSGIGVAVVDRGGAVAGMPVAWRCRASDGRLFAWVGVLADDAALVAADVEEWVEALAEGLPPHDRLLALEARSPLPLAPGGA